MDTSWVPLRDPHETASDRWVGLAAAVLVHLMLMAALVVSLDWSKPEPEPVQAELWSSLPAEAAPRRTPPSPRPVDATPVSPAKPTPDPDPGPTDAEIALEKKKAQEQLQRQRAAQDKALHDKLANEKAAKEKVAQEKAAKEKAAKEKTAKERAVKEKAEKDKLPSKEQARMDKALESQRAAELARLGIDPKAKAADRGKDARTKAGVTGGAEQGSRAGALANYSDAIRSRVRSRIRFDPRRAPENPEAIFEVEQLPTGQIQSIRLMKSSGRPDWDAAVKQAIVESDPLPKGADGLIERKLELRFRPQDRAN